MARWWQRYRPREYGAVVEALADTCLVLPHTCLVLPHASGENRIETMSKSLYLAGSETLDHASPLSSTAPVIQGCSPGKAMMVRLTCSAPIMSVDVSRCSPARSTTYGPVKFGAARSERARSERAREREREKREKRGMWVKTKEKGMGLE